MKLALSSSDNQSIKSVCLHKLQASSQKIYQESELVSILKQILNISPERKYNKGEVINIIERINDSSSTQVKDKLREQEQYISQLQKEKAKLKEQVEINKQDISQLQMEIINANNKIKQLEEEIKISKEVNSKLQDKLDYDEALKRHDGSNTGIPTSKTPINKKKVIPNGRVRTGRKVGGQVGHPKAKVKIPEKIDQILYHSLDKCNHCGSSNLEAVKKEDGSCQDFQSTYEVDVVVQTVVTEHRHPFYICKDCGKICCAEHNKAVVSYGPNVQSMILGATNVCNVPVNKVIRLLEGLTEGQVKPSEGYICSLQRKAAKKLMPFYRDLRGELIQRHMLYWDDTVARINGKNGCLRVYLDERMAYYCAHEHKDLAGVLDDLVLTELTEDTIVMHDHNIINYNEIFKHQNVECNAHLLRDFKKVANDTGGDIYQKLIKLIQNTIKKRKKLIEAGETCFTKKDTDKFFNKLKKLLTKAEKHAENNTNPYIQKTEKALVKRLNKHGDNYFRWVRDFSIPITNNLSERAIRNLKSKQNASGQFKNIKSAENFAIIKSFTETSRKNGINEFKALRRLMAGNPYTVREILSFQPDTG